MAESKDSGKRHDREEHYRCAAFLHPGRHRILRLMASGEELDGGSIAVELDESPGRIAYHLRVLLRHEALKARARSRPAPPLYRWAPQADWAREMLEEVDERAWEDD